MEMVFFNDSKSAGASRELMTHHGWLYDQRRIGNGKWHGPSRHGSGIGSEHSSRRSCLFRLFRVSISVEATTGATIG